MYFFITKHIFGRFFIFKTQLSTQFSDKQAAKIQFPLINIYSDTHAAFQF